MSLAYLGPIKTEFHGDPKFSWQGAPDQNGMRPASIAGLLTWRQVKQLVELTNNPVRKRTFAGKDGVLEPIWFTDELLREYRGFYLLGQVTHPPEQQHSLNDISPFTLSAISVGELQIVVPRSARTKGNDYAITGKAAVVNPFWGEDPAGEHFIIEPGGTFVTREYDPTTEHDSSRLVALDGSRQIGLNIGAITALGDSALPDLTQAADVDDDGVPRWISRRGGDCRAFDRRSMADVFGPVHPFVAPTDVVLTNGELRVTVGARSLPPYLNIEAFVGGAWVAPCFVQFGDMTKRLLRSELRHLTPDAVTLAIVCQGYGDIFVTLKRGERKLRVTVPHRDLLPAITGTPPTSRLVAAVNATGRFGKGLDGTAPDLRLLWPPSVSERRWSRVLWWKPTQAAVDIVNDAGLLTIYDDDGHQAVEVFFDATDNKIKFSLGETTTVASSAQTFAAGDNVCIGVRFSITEGMSLSVFKVGGAVQHVADPAALSPGTTGRYYQSGYVLNTTHWGDGAYGDGLWGGVNRYPNGVISNDMILDDRITDAEFAALAAATSRLGGLPDPESRLVWYASFNATPIPAFAAESGGRKVAMAVDDWGLTKALVYLRADHLESAVLLATSATLDTVADQHAQFAAECEQSVGVRARL